MEKEIKIRRTFMLKPSILEKLKIMSTEYDFTLNNMLERCIVKYNHENTKAKQSNNKTCILKYGESWKNK